jgi:hypothetical protein
MLSQSASDNCPDVSICLKTSATTLSRALFQCLLVGKHLQSRSVFTDAVNVEGVDHTFQERIVRQLVSRARPQRLQASRQVRVERLPAHGFLPMRFIQTIGVGRIPAAELQPFRIPRLLSAFVPLIYNSAPFGEGERESELRMALPKRPNISHNPRRVYR